MFHVSDVAGDFEHRGTLVHRYNTRNVLHSSIQQHNTLDFMNRDP